MMRCESLPVLLFPHATQAWDVPYKSLYESLTRFRCRKSALLRRWLVSILQFWDADWFTRAEFRSRALALSKSLFIGINYKLYEIMVWACQVGPFHLNVDSDKLRNELQS